MVTDEFYDYILGFIFYKDLSEKINNYPLIFSKIDIS